MTPSTNPPKRESIPIPATIPLKTKAVRVARTSAAKICQCAAMRFIPANQGDRTGEIQNHPALLEIGPKIR
jgi:hypothetical protein